MAEIVRSFRFPADLTPEQAEALAARLAAAPDVQQELARRRPSGAAGAEWAEVGVAREVRIDAGGRGCALVYELPEPAQPWDAWAAGSRPSSGEVLRAARQLCATLASACTGEGPGRHGGLCSAAVHVGGGGRLTILDFGVAPCFQEVLNPADPGWIEQVCECVAPEVWKNPGRSGPAADVFAAGVLLYQLATGVHPFGAIRDDADDCKYQILIELPVPPRQRAPELPEALSAFIYKSIRSEPQQRYHSFAEMQRAVPEAAAGSEPALAPAPPAAVFAAEDRKSPDGATAAPQTAAVDPEEQARQRYLEEQVRLKAEREEQQRRLDDQLKARLEQQTRRRQQTARMLAALRRHAVLASCAALVLVAGLVAAGVFLRAHLNGRAVRTRLDAAAFAATDQLRGGDAAAMAAALDLPAAPEGLADSVVHIRELDPQSACSIADVRFDSWSRLTGAARLMLGDQPVELGFSRDDQAPDGLDLTVSASELAAAAGRLAGALAGRELSAEPGLGELVTRIRAAFDPPATVTGVAGRLGELLDERGREHTAVLAYLEAHGDAKSLEAGVFRRMRGEDAVQCAVTLHSADQAALDLPLRLMFQYRCDPETRTCQLNRVRVDPLEEPEAHQRWCIQQSLAKLRAAFAAGDADQLAEWCGAQERDAIARTLAWAAQCRQAELHFSEPVLAAGSAQVQGRIRFTPGILNERSYSADAVLGFELDGGHGWLARPGLGNQWPGPPPPLARQLRGQDLLRQLSAALEERNAQAYADLFGGAATASAISEMFAKVAGDGVHFEVAAREDEHNPGLLHLDIQPRGINPELAALYPLRSYGFELRGDDLHWDGHGDPLWALPGLMYTQFTERFANATWSDAFDALMTQFESSGRPNMTPQEAQRFAESLQAVQAAREVFEPAGPRYIGGLPERVQLKQATGSGEPMFFRLVPIEGQDPYVMYVQEREVRVTDLGPRSDAPWEAWSRIVGPAPEGQAVGLTLEEAERFAALHGCRLPTVQEWETAAQKIGDAGTSRFWGGVWEMCHAAAGEPAAAEPAADSPAALMGGCWLDHEAGADLAALRRPIEERGFRFGTVGFRLCRPLRLAPDLVERISSALLDTGESSRS